MGFKYCLIPASPNDEIQELEFPEDILDLTNDTFRETVENYFKNCTGVVDKSVLYAQLKERTGIDVAEQTASGQLSNDHINAIIAQTSVEIFPALVPTKDTNFLSVSFYVDDKGVAKDLEINTRVSSLAKVAGYEGQVFRGDVFIGKVFDDNEDEWRRIDFTLNDVNADADWVKMTQKQRSGKNVNDMNKMASQFGANNAMHVNPSTMIQDVPNGDTEHYTWNQRGDEVEVTFKREGLKKGDKGLVKASFGRRKVKVVVSGDVLLDGEVYGNLDADACMWTLSDGVLQLTLTKDSEENWPSLLK